MLNCPLCNKEFGVLASLSKHIHKNHNIDSKNILMSSYPELFRDCGSCGVKIKYYKTDSQGRKFCCKECEISWRQGRKQSPETINKRIKNTDQKKKEHNRQKTMLNTYGNLTYFSDPINRAKKISNAHIGTKHTDEHHKKVIESKRKNGTIKHSNETKQKISKTLKEKINSPNFDKSVFVNQSKSNKKQGYYKGYYCRSTYEKFFVDFCEKYSIKLESAETNEFSVVYQSTNGKNKTYFPDFYLPELDLVIEIKPLTMYEFDDNISKYDKAKLNYRFVVITEEEHLLEPKNWDLLYEHICLI